MRMASTHSGSRAKGGHGPLVKRTDEAQRLAGAVPALECGGALRLPVRAPEREHGHDETDEEVLPQRAHAGTGAQRGARRSLIGRCTIAAPRPSAIEIHHIAS